MSLFSKCLCLQLSSASQLLSLLWFPQLQTFHGSIGQTASLFSCPPSQCSCTPAFRLPLPYFISYHLLSPLSSRSFLILIAHWYLVTSSHCCRDIIHLTNFITIIWGGRGDRHLLSSTRNLPPAFICWCAKGTNPGKKSLLMIYCDRFSLHFFTCSKINSLIERTNILWLYFW